VTAALPAAEPGGRLIELLAVHHDNQLLDTWQRLARAAAIGEHDFGAGVNIASLTFEQANTVLMDVAGVTRGLVLLDRRYSNVPGWAHLKQPAHLSGAAEATAILARDSGLDATVDARGWRPPAGRIDGPALPGFAGAVQAQHNLLVELGRFPNALNLRRVLHSQAQVSREAAKHAATTAPDLVERFRSRAMLYKELVRVSRDVGGLIGGGAQAVVESQNAASRLHRAHVPPASAREPIHDLHRLMMRTDARIAGTVERGCNENLYFTLVSYPRLMDQHVNGLHPARQRWTPVTSHVQTPLLGLVREHLRPPPVPARVPPESHKGRAAIEAVAAGEVVRVAYANQSR
jgi:hypothetical protein